jgi:hypothetical protein
MAAPMLLVPCGRLAAADEDACILYKSSRSGL